VYLQKEKCDWFY